MSLIWTKLTFQHQVYQISCSRHPQKHLHYRSTFAHLGGETSNILRLENISVSTKMTCKAGFVIGVWGFLWEILRFVISCVSWHQRNGQGIEILWRVMWYTAYTHVPCSVFHVHHQQVHDILENPPGMCGKICWSTILEQSLRGRHL